MLAKVLFFIVLLAVVLTFVVPGIAPYVSNQIALLLDQGVLKTAEGIPRKVVIRKDDTPLYDSALLTINTASAMQWDIFYVYKWSEGTYGVNPIFADRTPEKLFYLSSEDVFEWNTFFCLNYKNSPHQTNRDPVKTYATLEGATTGVGETVFQEKEEHSTYFSPQSAKPILQEYEGDIYRIASLYDNVRSDGTYVFLGNYDFGYVEYSTEAHELRRYVSKQQLQEQLLRVTGVTSLAKATINPTELDLIYGNLSNLLADFGDKLLTGVDEIRQVFSSEDIPDAASGGIFAPDALSGQQTEALQAQLLDLARIMNDYLINSRNWNDAGYAYIPAEWLQGAE